MTHRNNFVAVVKCGGAILREHDGAVMIPFGSEYSVLLKNLNDRKARVNISVDGQNVTEGKNLVVFPNMTTELEGFMEGAVVRNRFRFVRKTQEIVEQRGDRVDDGIVRVEFSFEEQVNRTREVVEHEHVHVHRDVWYPWDVWYPSYPWCPRPWSPYPGYIWTCSGDIGGVAYTSNSSLSDSTTFSASMVSSANSAIDCSRVVPPDINPDEGITVRGSETYQSFVPAWLGKMEDYSTVITIRLKGTDSVDTLVEKPITVRDKYICPTCGWHCGSDAQYCGRCGTYLLTKDIKHVS